MYIQEADLAQLATNRIFPGKIEVKMGTRVENRVDSDGDVALHVT